jgi:uncharacterized protein (DUF305 family)
MSSLAFAGILASLCFVAQALQNGNQGSSLLGSHTAQAQGGQGHTGAHHAGSGPSTHHGTASDSPFLKEMEASMGRMHQDMMNMSAMTGDADTDFLRMMVPHHQGAVEMAEAVLKHGKDARIKKLAKEIISAQKKEIAMMNAWLAETESKKAPAKKAK